MKKRTSLSTLSKKKILILISTVILVLGLAYACTNKQESNHSTLHHSKLHHIPLIAGHDDEKGRESVVNLEPSEPAQEDVHHKDHFHSMTQLFKHTKKGVDWKKEVRKVGSNVLVIAPHGGNIETGTTELTKLIANDNHYDYYSFTVLRKNMQKIYTSHRHITTIQHY